MTAGASSPPPSVLDLVSERQAARERRDFARADALRDQVRAAGWLIRDTAAGADLVEAPEWEPLDPAGITARWDEPDQHEVSVIVHVLGWPVVSHSMLDFEADDGPEVDAIEGYLLAVPRRIAAQVPLDPRHRYYRNADLDFSFAVRDLHDGSRPLRALRVAVPARRHRHRAYHETDPVQRERASKKNYNRFLEHWKRRTDLLTQGFTGYHRHPPEPGTGT